MVLTWPALCAPRESSYSMVSMFFSVYLRPSYFLLSWEFLKSNLRYWSIMSSTKSRQDRTAASSLAVALCTQNLLSSPQKSSTWERARHRGRERGRGGDRVSPRED